MTISDNGYPSLSSSTRVVVGVTDDNDESPQFLERQYRSRVPRLPLRRLNVLGLFRVVAFDRDIGPNGDIDYILAGDRGERADRGGRGGGVVGKLRIDSKTGSIYATSELEESHYNFVVSQLSLCCITAHCMNCGGVRIYVNHHAAALGSIRRPGQLPSPANCTNYSPYSL